MEETNYHRKVLFVNDVEPNAAAGTPTGKFDVGAEPVKGGNSRDNTDLECRTHGTYKKKSYLDKLKILNRQELQYPNRMKGMILRPLIFLSFPVISYAGFSYGSNLIWFNVLNGTASLILSKEPYGFSSSTVGLAYISPLIGVTLG